MKNIRLFLAIALALQTAALAASMPRSTRLQGTIASVAPSSITVATNHGNETIAIDSKTRILDLSKSSLDKVRNNSFIGTTVIPQPDGSYTSTEVHIFAEALRGMGQGFSKMNPSGTRMMANAAVRMPVNMMANATVHNARSAGGGKTISMTFPGRKIMVRMPANVPVSFISTSTRAALQRGKKVLAICNGAPGKFTAKTVVIMERGASLGS